jgi:D-lyxose ketol-isomerase
MKRSELNAVIADAIEFLAKHQFWLPPFAHWTPEQWRKMGPEANEIRSRHLGWDLTDFGSGQFDKCGLTLFTMRNGRADDPKNCKIYAEKLLLVREGQVTPLHFHFQKTEDIINRGAGKLVCKLFNSTPSGDLADTPIVVSCDGVTRNVKPGGLVVLEPGDSITLTPGLYHEFYAQPGAGMALVGEVSSVNDDATDNRFFKPVGRFPTIEEDVAPLRLLCNEYPG